MFRLPARRRFLQFSIAACATLLFVAVTFAAAKGKGILFPEWSGPTQGSYGSPYAELGKESSHPWSVTTVTSSISGKTLEGNTVSVVGEVVDLSCYLQVGKHGDKHRDCGQKCARNGQPIGILKEDGTVYMLIDEEHDPRRDGLTKLRAALIENMANIVKVHGTLSEVEGQKAIYVQTVK